MKRVVSNARRGLVSDNATDAEIRRLGNIDDDRILIHRTKEGNFVIPRGSRVRVNEGARFVDAPRRIKG